MCVGVCVARHVERRTVKSWRPGVGGCFVKRTCTSAKVKDDTSENMPEMIYNWILQATCFWPAADIPPLRLLRTLHSACFEDVWKMTLVWMCFEDDDVTCTQATRQLVEKFEKMETIWEPCSRTTFLRTPIQNVHFAVGRPATQAF